MFVMGTIAGATKATANKAGGNVVMRVLVEQGTGG
jgi:hypothetical protein